MGYGDGLSLLEASVSTARVDHGTACMHSAVYVMVLCMLLKLQCGRAIMADDLRQAWNIVTVTVFALPVP